MSITINNARIREVINQVVNDPDYKKVSEVPLISWHQIVLITLAYIGFLGGIYAYLNWDVSAWIVCPIMGLSAYIAFTPLHDATHRATSSNKLINDVLGSISAFLLFPFLTTPGYRFLHMSHHRYVGDDDLDPDSILVSIPTRYFPFGYLILPIFDIVWLYWAMKSGWFRMPKAVRAHIIFSIVSFIAFYTFFLTGDYWLEFIILYIIPSRIGLAYTGYVFGTIQHPDGVKWDELPFESTNVIKGKETSLMVKTLLGQGFHSMHHFLPHVPWYKYHKVWELGNGIFKKQPIPERAFFDKLDKNARDKFLAEKEKEITSVKVKISEITEVAKNIKSFTFEPIDNNPLPEFTAGSHIEITLPSGKKRCYSLVNPQYETNQYQIAVKQEENGKGGSKEMHQLTTGEIVEVSVPRNNFVLYEQAKRFKLISGGIGITPMISMAHRLEELDKHFEFHICAKEESEVPFTYQLKHWSFAPMVEMHLDKNGKSSIDLTKVLSQPDEDTLIYICGPAGFMNWVKTTALEIGWSKNNIKQELFAADTSNAAPPKPFEVVLNKTGKTVTVPKNMSIIDAVEMHGVKIDYSCLQGTCGTCVCNVVEGEVDHRDAVLSEDEKLESKQICLCVSRAKNDKITLDL